MINRTMLFAPLLALLGSGGCTINGPNDPLTGTWTNTSCYGSGSMPVDIQSCSLSLAFGADLSIVLTDQRQALPATLIYPRCTTTRRVSGQQYSTSNGASASMIVTVSGNGTSTVERTGCANPSDNAAPAPDSVDSIPNGGTTYEISASVLTIPTGPLAGHYSRSIL